MNIAIFVSIFSSTPSAELDAYFRAAPLDWLKSQPAVDAVEFYSPEPGDVPKLDDEPPPAIIVQIDVGAEATARELVEASEFREHFLDGSAAANGRTLLELTEVVNYPLPGKAQAATRSAPLSFVVRYYGPVADGREFVEFYTKNHPPIVGKFPNIRNVLCYLPLGWKDSGRIDDSRLLIGNEVVFDDLDALLAAMNTPVLQEALDDAELFQAFGASTHHAMHREKVYSRS